MRADRLVAILLLLQTRGQVTAAEVAAELEISERTARRDLDALGVAGLPVYSQPGRNGGWRLAGGGRTDLSGLTAAEARALFLVAGTSSATPEVKAALRKLVRALPAEFRESAEAAATAVVVDPVGWDRPTRQPRPPEHLDAVQRAVVESEQIRLGYVARDGASTTRVVHPLGLATKGSSWYLVADTDAGLRTFRVDRVTAVERTGDAVVRPDGFDLDEAWGLIADEVDRRRAPLRVRALAAPRGRADAALDPRHARADRSGGRRRPGGGRAPRPQSRRDRRARSRASAPRRGARAAGGPRPARADRERAHRALRRTGRGIAVRRYLSRSQRVAAQGLLDLHLSERDVADHGPAVGAGGRAALTVDGPVR